MGRLINHAPTLRVADFLGMEKDVTIIPMPYKYCFIWAAICMTNIDNPDHGRQLVELLTTLFRKDEKGSAKLYHVLNVLGAIIPFSSVLVVAPVPYVLIHEGHCYYIPCKNGSNIPSALMIDYLQVAVEVMKAPFQLRDT
jgi:hypothetical protein